MRGWDEEGNVWCDEGTVGDVLLRDSIFVGVQAFGLLRRMLRILHMRQENGLAELTLRFSKVSKADHPTPHRRGANRRFAENARAFS
jgi:hypothetical protein